MKFRFLLNFTWSKDNTSVVRDAFVPGRSFSLVLSLLEITFTFVLPLVGIILDWDFDFTWHENLLVKDNFNELFSIAIGDFVLCCIVKKTL